MTKGYGCPPDEAQSLSYEDPVCSCKYLGYKNC
jgi:hypothetical protein